MGLRTVSVGIGQCLAPGCAKNRGVKRRRARPAKKTAQATAQKNLRGRDSVEREKQQPADGAILDLEKQQYIIQALKRSEPRTNMARVLGVDVRTVHRLIARTLEGMRGDRDKAIAQFFDIHMMRCDELLNRWYLDAHGGVVRDQDGNEKRVEKNVHAARLYARVLSDTGRFIAIAASGINVNTQINVGTNLVQSSTAKDVTAVMSKHFGARAVRGLSRENAASPNVTPIDARSYGPTPDVVDVVAQTDGTGTEGE